RGHSRGDVGHAACSPVSERTARQCRPLSRTAGDRNRNHEQFRANRLRHGGPVYTFDLTDGTETVHVVAFAKPPCESGAATVEGTFETVKRRIKASYPLQEFTAHNVICLPDTVDPRGPKAK